MFVRLPAADMRLIGRGVLLLLIMILIGTLAVEKQLYHLTQSPEYVRAVAMRQEENGSYRLLLLGSDFIVNWVYPIGSLVTDEYGVSAEIGSVRCRIPRIYYLDGKRFFVNLEALFLEAESWSVKAGQAFMEQAKYWWIQGRLGG